MFLTKHKRIALIAFAVLFVGTLFLIKIKTNLKIELNGGEKTSRGLTYDENMVVADLLNQDSDGNGIVDWQENLLEGSANQNVDGNTNFDTNNANLTQTDEFSRELFSTIAALNQAGQMDQPAIDRLSASLAEKIQSPTVRKVYLTSELNISSDNSTQSFSNYNKELSAIYRKYPIKVTVLDVLIEFVNDGENVNADALSKLDPIIGQTNNILGEMVKMSVPDQLSDLHLTVINTLEELIENTSDIKLFDADPVVAMGAMKKYTDNTDVLKTAIQRLAIAISSKLNS